MALLTHGHDIDGEVDAQDIDAARIADRATLAELLDRVAHTIAERGTATERPVLERLASAAGRAGPGAAAALVDWSGSEVARLRAFGVLHGVVLALGPSEQRLLLARIRGGPDAPLSG